MKRLTEPVLKAQDLRSHDSLLDLNPRRRKGRFSLKVTRALISLNALAHSSRSFQDLYFGYTKTKTTNRGSWETVQTKEQYLSKPWDRFWV